MNEHEIVISHEMMAQALAHATGNEAINHATPSGQAQLEFELEALMENGDSIETQNFLIELERITGRELISNSHAYIPWQASSSTYEGAREVDIPDHLDFLMDEVTFDDAVKASREKDQRSKKHLEKIQRATLMNHHIFNSRLEQFNKIRYSSFLIGLPQALSPEEVGFKITASDKKPQQLFDIKIMLNELEVAVVEFKNITHKNAQKPRNPLIQYLEKLKTSVLGISESFNKITAHRVNNTRSIKIKNSNYYNYRDMRANLDHHDIETVFVGLGDDVFIRVKRDEQSIFEERVSLSHHPKISDAINKHFSNEPEMGEVVIESLIQGARYGVS